jgi:ribosome maturation factor RimP
LKKEKLSSDIGRIVEELGYECVNAAPVTEEGRSVVRVTIDSLGGINVSDCETVSKAVSRYLDGDGEADLGGWSGRYYLEVSSPGAERPLLTPADYERFRGREARVKTFEAIDGRKTHVGVLAERDGEAVFLETEQGRRRIPFGAIARAALVFRGLEPEPKKAGGKAGKTPKAKCRKNGENRENEEV